MSNKLLIIIAIVISITGCATPSEIKKNGPSISVLSTKTAREVAGCIAAKWEEAPFFSKLTGSIKTGIKQNGYSVTAEGKNAFGIFPVLISEVDETGTGCAVTYFTTKPLINEEFYTEAINQCK